MFDGREAQRFRTTINNTDVHHDLLGLNISQLAKNLHSSEMTISMKDRVYLYLYP